MRFPPLRAKWNSRKREFSLGERGGEIATDSRPGVAQGQDVDGPDKPGHDVSHRSCGVSSWRSRRREDSHPVELAFLGHALEGFARTLDPVLVIVAIGR